jgi:hypothetical protein
MPNKTYNLRYTSKTGEEVTPSRCGIKFDQEVNVGDFITYKGVLLLVREVKGYLVIAVERKGNFHVGRD